MFKKFNMFENNNVEIQAQDGMGNWRTYSYALNNSQRVINEMRQLSGNFPSARIRAVD